MGTDGGWTVKCFAYHHVNQRGAKKHAPLRHPQCPFIQMTDTDVALLPNYNKMDLARSHVLILTSTPPLPCFRLWQGWACDWINRRISLIQELPVLESLPSPSHSVSFNVNNWHLISHSSLTISNWIVLVCTSQSLPPLHPCLPLHFRQGWGASVLCASHPLI
jgi:hypothetical protein